MDIREAKLEDAGQIAEIYNHYILNTHHTFETEELTDDDMLARIEAIEGEYPFLVAEDEGQVLGYVYAAQFKLRDAYKYAAEASIYVKNKAKEKGVGSRLYEEFLKELEDTNIHTIVAGISLPNDPSIRFHEKLGFKKVAHFEEVGYKLGRWVDVGYWEMLNAF